MEKLYVLMKLISTLVRQFVLPNPFECFGELAWLYNWVSEPFMHLVAYGLVGLVYTRGSAPALGSFLYLIAYAALIKVLEIMGIFSFAWWWVAIVVVAMIIICVLLGKLGRWLSGETW